MPNWCSTNITINCKNAEEARMLYKKIEEGTSVEYCKSDFGRFWLGNLVGNLGIDSMKDGKDFSVRCRGTITCFDCYEDEEDVFIMTETAWCPMLQMWEMICDKYLSEYKIWYEAEEGGCGLFFTNNPQLVGKYLIDSMNDEFTRKFLDGVSYNDIIDEEELKAILQKCLDTSKKDVNTLLDMFDKSDYEDVWINPWEYVPISELD